MKEIEETLSCSWLAEIEKKMRHKRLRKKLGEYGYKPEIIEKIMDFYTK